MKNSSGVVYEEYENRGVCQFIRNIRNDFKKMGEEGDPRSETSSLWAALLYGDERFRGYQYGSNKFEEPFGYIYYTECLDTNMSYIGQHRKSKFDKSYYGSGTLLRDDIKSGKVKKDNIDRVVLDWAYSVDEINSKEKFWISFFDAYRSSEFYNSNSGGQSCHPLTKSFSKKQRLALSEAMKEYYKTHEVWNKGIPRSDETKRKLSVANKGRPVSEKERKRRSEFRKGKTHSEEVKKKISESHKGKTLSKESRDKISKTKRGRKMSDEARLNISKGHSVKVICVETGEVFDSVGKFVKCCGKGGAYFYRRLRDGKSYPNGLHYTYLDKDRVIGGKSSG